MQYTERIADLKMWVYAKNDYMIRLTDFHSKVKDVSISISRQFEWVISNITLGTNKISAPYV